MFPRLALLVPACLLPALAARAQLGSSTTDPYARAFYGEVAMTPGVSYPAGRSLKAVCTTSGAISLTYSDGSTGIWNAAVGTQTFPVEAVAVNPGSTTANCSFASLK